MESSENNELRQRNLEQKDATNQPVSNPSSQGLGQGTDEVPFFLKPFAANLSPKAANALTRSVFTVVLISIFSLTIYFGPLALVLLVLLIQLGCFREIINIGYIVYKSKDLPLFRTLSWFFLFTSNYFLFGESLITRFRILLAKEDFLSLLMTHHRFISFCLYCAGIIAFVLSLVKRHYLQQFTLFGWTHVTLLLIVTSSHFIIQNIFNGTIWFLVPVSMVICNDIFAYIFGVLFGRTPLIQLSPKKTWEGFIGGGLCTLIWGILFSNLLIGRQEFICPIEYDDVAGSLTLECVRNPVFIPRQTDLASWTITWYPYYQHCLIIALFTSIVGPFGGFFASGFKRAFNIKDFGDTIPGHGGIMDRFDCQVIIGTFVFFYYNSFVGLTNPTTVLQQVYVLPTLDQLDFYLSLTDGLHRRDILTDTAYASISKMVNDLIVVVRGREGKL